MTVILLVTGLAVLLSLPLAFRYRKHRMMELQDELQGLGAEFARVTAKIQTRLDQSKSPPFEQDSATLKKWVDYYVQWFDAKEIVSPQPFLSEVLPVARYYAKTHGIELNNRWSSSIRQHLLADPIARLSSNRQWVQPFGKQYFVCSKRDDAPVKLGRPTKYLTTDPLALAS